MRVIIDKTTNQWPYTGSDEGGNRENSHWVLKFVLGKQVADRSARDGQECATREAAEKSSNDNGFNVAADSLWYSPDEIYAPGREIDGPSAIELAQGAET